MSECPENLARKRWLVIAMLVAAVADMALGHADDAGVSCTPMHVVLRKVFHRARCVWRGRVVRFPQRAVARGRGSCPRAIRARTCSLDLVRGDAAETPQPGGVIAGHVLDRGGCWRAGWCTREQACRAIARTEAQHGTHSNALVSGAGRAGARDGAALAPRGGPGPVRIGRRMGLSRTASSSDAARSRALCTMWARSACPTSVLLKPGPLHRPTSGGRCRTHAEMGLAGSWMPTAHRSAHAAELGSLRHHERFDGSRLPARPGRARPSRWGHASSPWPTCSTP